MGYRDDIVDIALSQLGYTEGPNNDTKYGDWYGLPNQPWCAMFVSWCADQANVPQDIIYPFASCTTGFRWFTNEDETTREHIEPQKGDIIFFIWSKGESTPDHVGIVERVEDGRVYTIEGNRSDKVQQFSYDLDSWQIYGYAFPDYGDTPTPPTPPEPSYDQTIADGQQWVNDYGFNIAVDGEFGPETLWGLTCVYQNELNIQFNAGLKVDGKFGPETKKKTPVIKEGASGNITRCIQYMLYCKGYNPNEEFGTYGYGTSYAVGVFQEDHNLTIDKRYGPETGLKLFN